MARAREEELSYDLAMIRACLDGAPGAFERLIDGNRRIVHHAVRCALESVGAQGDADLCDEAFVRVFSSLAADGMKMLRSFEGRSRLATFLAVVARRTALRLFSERRPRAPGPALGPEHGPEPCDAAPGPDEAISREEVRAIVREAIASLSARDALAIRLFYESGLGHRELGSVLGVPVTHVGQILARAREKLRTRLSQSVLGPELQEGVSYGAGAAAQTMENGGECRTKC